MRTEYEDRLASTDVETSATPAAAEAATRPAEPRETSAATPRIVEDVVIEEVSIDGMCGVY